MLLTLCLKTRVEYSNSLSEPLTLGHQFSYYPHNSLYISLDNSKEDI